MPIVFVHGVGVRNVPPYEDQVRKRDEFFKTFVLPELEGAVSTDSVANPYWGDRGAQYAWGNICVPGTVETLGPGTSTLRTILARHSSLLDQTNADEATLLRIARQSFEEAIDILWIASAGESDDADDELLQLAKSATNYALADPNPEWLAEIKDDEDFLGRLIEKIEPPPPPAEEQVETLGVIPSVRGLIEKGLGKIIDIARDIPTTALVSSLRSTVHGKVSDFLGDIIAFSSCREPVLDIVRASLEQARTTPDGPPLVVVAHSMGGNIMYELLTRHPEIKIDTLVTVGSQVGFFEELKFFTMSASRIPNRKIKRVPRPANVKRWVNIFDHNDVLGFAAAPVFSGVRDIAYTTWKGLGAHSGYFIRPSFYQRLTLELRQPSD